jgi:hypothetical protein
VEHALRASAAATPAATAWWWSFMVVLFPPEWTPARVVAHFLD